LNEIPEEDIALRGEYYIASLAGECDTTDIPNGGTKHSR